MNFLPTSSLSARFAGGQVFLTWNEAHVQPGTTFNVYSHIAPLRENNLSQARLLARRIEPQSARDWWQDPASFDSKAAHGIPIGFRIEAGAHPLAPHCGLFVHTVGQADEGPRFYAVTSVAADGHETREIRQGANALSEPVVGRSALIQPIWQEDGPGFDMNAGMGMSLLLNLHGRSGGAVIRPNPKAANYLLFGDYRMGWREGLAFKFFVRISPGLVYVTPFDRAWTGGRPLTESADQRDHCPAINTFWYGYHSGIAETTLTPQAIAPNYTEEYLLRIMRWAQEFLGTDPTRAYISGASMGGSGAVSMALHHPHQIAAVVADVPVFSFTRPGKGSATRLECLCGSLDRPVVTSDGTPLLDHMNGVLQVQRAAGDLPYIFATNGRRDASIPWENNPPFYRAMLGAKQGLTAYWNNGTHEMCFATPPDVRAWGQRFHKFRLDTSHPVFTNCSDDRDPGDGDPARGDLEGWINRGLDWHDIVDEDSEYKITVTADYPGIKLPVTVDITPRRVQKFRLSPCETVSVFIDDKPPGTSTADASGRFTIKDVRIAAAAGVRIRVTRRA